MSRPQLLQSQGVSAWLQESKFDQATPFRNEIYELKTILAEKENLKPWERIKLMAGE